MSPYVMIPRCSLLTLINYFVAYRIKGKNYFAQYTALR